MGLRVKVLPFILFYNFANLQCNYIIKHYKLSIRFAHLNMQVHHNIQNLPVFKNAVITIGTFDGVHTGHQQIIQQMLSEANAIDGETVVITFHPHPKMIVTGAKHDIKVLNTLAEKITLLQKHGVHHLVVVPFTNAFAGQTAHAYIKDFLVERFHPHTIIIGYDHRFGAGRKGDYHLLEDEAPANNFVVKEIPEHVLQNITISSTKIRGALLTGDIQTANEFLGYPYFFTGKVVEGNKLGRTIGYPTANLSIEEEHKLIPGNGVYAVEVVINKSLDVRLKGMMNIGVRPTVSGNLNRVIEINIFEFDADIYKQELTVFIRTKLRNEVKFNSLEELKNQLAKDKEDSLAVL
jgi:riboflavin kinase / FMN adenylyltransferase